MLGQIGMEHRLPGLSGRLLLDAIVRTLARLFVTRRKLLEWETAASTEQRLGTDLAHFVAGHVAGAGSRDRDRSCWSLAMRPDAMAAASPFLVAWLLSPYVAFFLSRPSARGTQLH